MRTFVIVLSAAVALVFAGQAAAGCWATVGISPFPTGLSAGETWNVDVRVLQHGRTPLEDATPTVVVADAGTGEEHSFAAVPTREAGVYRAAVTFPSEGNWSVAVHDGFPEVECAQTHTFMTHAIGPPSGAAGPATGAPDPVPPDAAAVDPGGSRPWPVVAGVLGALALLAVGLAVRHGRPRSTVGA
jgi:hypothetical protein